MMIGLRVLRQIRILKSVVDVGLVTGITASTGPSGWASSVMPARRSSETTPTVFKPLMSS